MNAQSFLDNFRTIARAPGGVGRVRELVYFFAITGGLSRPEAGDSDANLILENSHQAKLDYYEDNSVRQGARKHSEIFQVVKRVPSHWVMVAAGDLVHLINGRAFKSTDWKKSGLPIIRIQNLNNPTAPFNYFQGEVAEGHRVRAGDMLLSWSGTPGTSFGVFIWNSGDAVLNQHIFKVAIYSSKISKKYLRMAINASLDALIGSARGGVGLKHVTKGQIESLQIPLPPLEEQNRIVAKVDELMRLCDRLEAQQQEREKLLPLLSRANHTRFVAEPTPATLVDIFRPISSCDDLRKTILKLAVHGKLVPQCESDPNANELIFQIKHEKRTLIANKRLKETSSHTHRSSGSEEYAIPEGWAWVTLNEVTDIGTGSTPSKSRPEYYRNGTIPWVTSSATNNEFIIEPEQHVTEDAIKECNLKIYPKGSLLVALYGQGKTRGQVGQLMFDSTINQACAGISFFGTGIEIRDYVRLFFRKKYDEIRELAAGGAQPNLSGGLIRLTRIPLPPLPEQRRIVDVVTRLMRLIDELERKKIAIHLVSREFSIATVNSITRTDHLDNELMKPPHIEIVTALTVGRKPKKAEAAPLATLLSKQQEGASAKTLWQLSGLEIETFYQQLKTEIANGWIEEDTTKREVKEVEVG